MALRRVQRLLLLAGCCCAPLGRGGSPPRCAPASAFRAQELLDRAVHTDGGLLVGAPPQAGGVAAYRGIPYAAPPTGQRRWRRPAALQPWDKRQVLNASSFGPPCAQFGPAWPSLGGWSATSSGVRDPGSSSEDCLYLNVYAPTNADEAPCQALLRRRCSAAPVSVSGCRVCAGRLQHELQTQGCTDAHITSFCGSPPPPPHAVVVYIHAGGFTWGGGNDAESNGLNMPSTPGWNSTVLVTLNYRRKIVILSRFACCPSH